MSQTDDLHAPRPAHSLSQATPVERQATTLVVCDGGCDCADAIWQALRRDHDLVILVRGDGEPLRSFGRRVAHRMNRISMPVAEAFVGTRRSDAAYASFIRSLVRVLPAGVTLTFCSGSPVEQLRCQAIAQALAAADRPPIAFRVAPTGPQGCPPAEA